MKKHKGGSSITLLEKTGIWAGYAILGLYLAINIALSQVVSPLYFSLIKEEYKTAISFLAVIKPLPIFQEKLALYENLYGNQIETAVFREELAKNSMINNFEQIMTLNPSARDILYNLFVLYQARGDEKKALEYFQRAHHIDPALQ